MGGSKEGGRELGGRELAGSDGGREGGSLAARPIASARFVMSQDLVGLASTSSSRGQREWETQRRLLSNERSRSAATCHSLFGWMRFDFFLLHSLKPATLSGSVNNRKKKKLTS